LITERVIGLIFFVLLIYQVMMTGFLILYKQAIYPGIFVALICALTMAAGVYILVFYFGKVKRERKILGVRSVDLNNFKNLYINPCIVAQKKLKERQNPPKIVSCDFIDAALHDLSDPPVIEFQDSWMDLHVSPSSSPLPDPPDSLSAHDSSLDARDKEEKEMICDVETEMDQDQGLHIVEIIDADLSPASHQHNPHDHSVPDIDADPVPSSTPPEYQIATEDSLSHSPSSPPPLPSASTNESEYEDVDLDLDLEPDIESESCE